MEKQIDQIIKDLMTDKRWTVRDLAKEAKVGSVRTVYTWINGEAKPNRKNAYGLADAFGVDPRVFLD